MHTLMWGSASRRLGVSRGHPRRPESAVGRSDVRWADCARRDKRSAGLQLVVDAGDRKHGRDYCGRRKGHEARSGPPLRRGLLLTRRWRPRWLRLPLLRGWIRDPLMLDLEPAVSGDPFEPTGGADAGQLALRVCGGARSSRSGQSPGKPVAPMRVMRVGDPQLEHRPHSPGLSPVCRLVSAEAGRPFRERRNPGTHSPSQMPVLQLNELRDHEQVAVAVAAAPVGPMEPHRERPALMLDDQERIPVLMPAPRILRLARDLGPGLLGAGELQRGTKLTHQLRRHEMPRNRRRWFRHGDPLLP